ncbi:MAG: CDP-diacylglycerol--serine O-phosphatidyltransferase [Marinilabiliales bacterium]|nr:MAG: CDP-diacylglycerol--serine O-phosphatidyltransferase [Marinilabiliales bacterium]
MLKLSFSPLKKIIPSIFTMFNLLSGCMAILISFSDPALAGLLILLAGIFDFADGFAARLLDAYSEFGKELDSLADIISFGAAPSFILFHLINTSLVMSAPHHGYESLSVPHTLILASAFLPVVFAAIRLAKYNISTGESDDFSGLPSPAAGIFIASAGYVLVTSELTLVREFFFNPATLVSAGIIVSVLMVIPIRMFSIKFRHFRLAGNRVRYLFLLPSLVLFIWWGIAAIPLITGWYVFLSAIIAITCRKQADPGHT